jgi:hypothetical protein
MIGVSFLVAIVLAATPVAATDFSFHVDPAAMGAYDQPLYVDDATLKAAIPSLNGAGARLSTCINSMTFPASGYIEFTPTVTGMHSATSNRLLCALPDPENIECHAVPDDARRVAFDTDASRYFHLGGGIDLQEALEIVRAFEHGRVEIPDGSQPMVNGLPLREVARKGDHVQVGFGDCGCRREMSVTRRRVAGRWVVSGKIVSEICI